jgi:hypothetical protein
MNTIAAITANSSNSIPGDGSSWLNVAGDGSSWLNVAGDGSSWLR